MWVTEDPEASIDGLLAESEAIRNLAYGLAIPEIILSSK